MRRVWMTATVLAGLACGSAWAQGRGRLTISGPGGLRRPGESANSGTFRNYSAGGSLHLPSIGSDEGVLRSSIGQGVGDYTLRSGGGQPGDLATGLAELDLPSAQGRRVYEPLLPSSSLPADGGGDLLAGWNPDATVGAAEGFLETVAASSVLQARESASPITSLVPERESAYQQALALGDRAFRLGDFSAAMAAFGSAVHMGPDQPEALLSAMHARFALSTVGYAECASYLERALRYFPELPLVPLRPREFFGRKVTYVEKLQGLERHLAETPRDAAAQFVYAYFQWFEGDVAAARASLAAAARNAYRPGFAEAVETFWRGMVASGKVSGRLREDAGAAPAGAEAESGRKDAAGGAGEAAPPAQPEADRSPDADEPEGPAAS